MWYYVALVTWLPYALPGSLFIYSLCARVLLERSTYGGWHNPPGTSSDSRGGSLEQVARVPTTQRQEKLSVNNQQFLLKPIGVIIIYPIYWKREIIALLSRYKDVHYSDSIQFRSSHWSTRERKREGACTGLWTETYLPSHRVPHPLLLPTKGPVHLNSTDNRLLNNCNLNYVIFKISKFLYILKFIISFVRCHLIKLIRHLIMIITCVPNFQHVFVLPHSNLWLDMNVLYLHLAFLSGDDRCLLSSIRWCMRLTFLIWLTFPLKDFS